MMCAVEVATKNSMRDVATKMKFTMERGSSKFIKLYV